MIPKVTIFTICVMSFIHVSKASPMNFADVGDSQFTFIGNGYCAGITSVYPKLSSPTLLSEYADTDDVPGLGSKQTCLKKCVESFGIVQGIFLPFGKCGCCPGWDRRSYHTGFMSYDLYRISEDVEALMLPLSVPTRSPMPSWYGDSSMFEYLGNGYCGKWHRYPVESTYGDTTGSGVQNSNPKDVTRGSYCAHMCVDALAPLEVKGFFLANLQCGCCLAHASDGEAWNGEYNGLSPTYHLYKFTRATSETKESEAFV